MAALHRSESDIGWVKRRIMELEKKVEQNAAARRLEAATIGAGGVTVKDRGFLKVLNKLGAVRLWLGGLNFLDSDGDPQTGFLLYRDGDNSLALGMYDANPGDGYQQALNWFDRSGQVVVADDTNGPGGIGLARPYIPYTMHGISQVESTTSGTFATVYTIAGYHQHPKMVVPLLASCPAGTTGEVRIEDAAGNVLAGPTTIPDGGSVAPFYIFVRPGAHMEWQYTYVKARTTGGAGAASVRLYAAMGRQT